MAKTLIGNIKGKNGRGITSIKKTGTTGPVDTYTITYTDDTTSTFTVNNSDNIVLQRQIVPSAAVESSATASQAYAAGDYVVVKGLLRKVKAAIARGNAISDSNSTATTVTRELATLGDSVSRMPRIIRGKADVVGTFSNNYYTANVSFGQDLGTSNYTLMTSMLRDDVRGVFHHVRSKTRTGFTVSVDTTMTYSNEGFTIEWVAFI